MIRPIRLMFGVNNKIIFKMIKNNPILTNEKTKTAKPNTNLKSFSLFRFIYFIRSRYGRHTASLLFS